MDKTHLVVSPGPFATEFLVGPLYLLKAHFRKRFKVISEMLQFVRVIFEGKLPVGLLDLCCGCASVYPQDVVRVPGSGASKILLV